MPFQLSQDPNFHYEAIRSLGLCRYHGGDVGEQLAILPNIKPGDFESWYEEWHNLALRVLSTIDENNPEKHSATTLSDAYYRASHYFFVADFFLHGNIADPRLNGSFKLWRTYFDKAIEQVPIPTQHFAVPTKHGFEVPVIAFRAAEVSPASPRPTLLIGGGFDSNYEELMHCFAYPALERGYNAIIYEGPGQPRLLQEQKVGFIHDWEKVVTPVIDFVHDHHNEFFSYIDLENIALVGLSLGGYLAARAAAFEPRLAAVICIDGVMSMLDTCLKGFPDAQDAYERKDIAGFNAAFENTSEKSSTNRRWIHDHLKYSFRKETGWEVFEEIAKMNLEGVAQNIKMPAFIGKAEKDIFFAGQPERVADAIGSNATLVEFGIDHAASEHCQSGANVYLSQMHFDWLKDIFAARK